MRSLGPEIFKIYTRLSPYPMPTRGSISLERPSAFVTRGSSVHWTAHGVQCMNTCSHPDSMRRFKDSSICGARTKNGQVNPNMESTIQLIRTPCYEFTWDSHMLVNSLGSKLSFLSDSVRSCKQLVTLACPPLDLAAWEYLSNLRALLEVAISKSGRRFPSLQLDLNNHHFDFTPFLNLAILYFPQTQPHTSKHSCNTQNSSH